MAEGDKGSCRGQVKAKCVFGRRAHLGSLLGLN